MIWIIYAAVQTVLPVVVSCVMFAGIGTLVVRSDLVAKAIKDGLQQDKTAKREERAVVAGTGEWARAADWLADVPVLPVVRVQVLINRLRRFRSDRLATLARRLGTLERRLSDTKRMEFRARIAYKFELSQVMMMMMDRGITTTTATIASNTDVKRKVAVTHVVLDDDSDQEMKQTVHIDGPSDGSESLYETVKELAVQLLGAILLLRSALISEGYRRKIIMVYRLSRYAVSLLKSNHFRYVAKTAVDLFEKFISVRIVVLLDSGEITMGVNIFPELENV